MSKYDKLDGIGGPLDIPYDDAWDWSDDPFLTDMAEELQRAEREHRPYNSVHEAYAVILEELDEFWEFVRMKREKRDTRAMRRELLQIAVTAWRASRDLGLESDEGEQA